SPRLVTANSRFADDIERLLQRLAIDARDLAAIDVAPPRGTEVIRRRAPERVCHGEARRARGRRADRLAVAGNELGKLPRAELQADARERAGAERRREPTERAAIPFEPVDAPEAVQ